MSALIPPLVQGESIFAKLYPFVYSSVLINCFLYFLHYPPLLWLSCRWTLGDDNPSFNVRVAPEN